MEEKKIGRRSSGDATTRSNNDDTIPYDTASSTLGPKEEEKGRGAREQEKISRDVDLEKAIGYNHRRGEEEDSSSTSAGDADSIQSADRNVGDNLAHTKSLRSTKSRRSYAGGDGYTCFEHDDDQHERPNKSTGSTAAAPAAADGDPFLVTWDGDSDPMNPRSMPKWRRWIVVLILSGSSLCVTCTSSLYTITYGQLITEFQTSRIVCTLGLSLFVAGLGTGPMLLAPLSEFYGRRPIYICSFTFFLIWLIPCAAAQNIQTMLIGRFLNGFVGSAFLSVAGGTVGDMFARHELSAPMMVYTASPFVGPEVGPLIGGFIVENTTWRWCFYVLIIWSGVQLLSIVLLVPETYHPVLLRNKARKLREETGEARWIAPIEQLSRSIPKTIAWSCIRPFQLLFFEPMCLSLCVLSAILLGILYLFFGAFALVFQNNHHFTVSQLGLSFLGLFVGMVLGIASDPFWRGRYDRLVQQREAQGGEPGGSEPEFRLVATIYGAIVVPVALFGFGWTTFPHVHWIVPIIFSGVFGLGVIWCYSGIFTFLVECYPLYAASALAANSFARSYFAGAFPLFGVQMYENLGYQWATTVLAFLALAMAPFPPLFFKYGKKLRGKSRFASA
ncbi:MFS general substrate transporter [Aaosphaeria arxii CBS 175.79]|uniref:MFS general substrate transporter n=1 Tax=Aaosphaeria arxii CBS 175.79 TaxID=1450172 RepID=A0A6A5X9N8_9PLEO|nr:MFS general substrate transporter [Aaosphaeria arxii CBS 175.79]KAF2009630.1 MFS general substrate transporter [Aaosphaeria arxii CBS 175.79]